MSAPVLMYDRVGDNVVTVDVGILLGTRLLAQANSGGGKSRLIRSLLEQTHGKVQHIVIDSEGEFGTLREKYSYVLAAKEGDVPAHPKVAKVLCRRLIEIGASAILDIYDLSLVERREFVKLFLNELMALPRSLWKPVIVVIDEAHNFAPQSGEAQSTDAVIALCTQGRKRGFCAVLATQRISKLHKDAAAELNNKLIGRTGLDVDQKRAGDDLGFDKEQRLSLRDLPAGTFYAFGPAMGNGVQVVQTAPVKTTHPDSNTIGTLVVPANATVQTLVAQIGDLPKLADRERDEKAALEQRVRELQTQLRAKPAPIVEQKTVTIDATAAQLKKANDEGYEEAVADYTARMRNAFPEFTAGSQAPKPEPKTQPRVVNLPAESVPVRAPVVITGNAPTRVSRGDIGKTPQRMLNALAEMITIGIDPATRAQLGAWVGISHTTGTFRTYLSELRSAGLIADAQGGDVQLTDDGSNKADASADPIRDVSQIHTKFYNRLGATPCKMLRVLIDAYPRSVSRNDLGDLVGISASTGTFRTYLSELRSLCAIVDVDKVNVRAAGTLFPEALL